MEIYYTPDHSLHTSKAELHRGAFVPPHEGPHRMDWLVEGLNRSGFTDFKLPVSHPVDSLATIHSEDYLHFLQTAWQRWQDAGYAGDVLPMSYPHRPRRPKPPADIDGAAGYFASSSDVVITETTWQGVKACADCALTAAAKLSDSAPSAFTLIRPPGHHAGRDYMAGYCYLNNAALAAQALRDAGAARIGVLDIDFHHGNGTQDIFYARGDVLFASLHGDPDHHFPYFWGHRDEIGEGAGEGFTANYPLPGGTRYSIWKEALLAALDQISRFGPDALIVSLGVDTYEKDPISAFKLRTPDYWDCGRTIAGLKRPTLFVMEGGYGVPEVGDNVAQTLLGFLGENPAQLER